MPDITMCLNEKCERKEVCHRFTALPNTSYQSYAMFGKEGQCNSFLPVYEKSKAFVD